MRYLTGVKNIREALEQWFVKRQIRLSSLYAL